MIYLYDLYYGNNFIASVRKLANGKFCVYAEEDIVKVSNNEKLDGYKSLQYVTEKSALAHAGAFLSIQCSIPLEEIKHQVSTKNRISSLEKSISVKEWMSRIIAHNPKQFPKEEPLAEVYTLDDNNRVALILDVVRKANVPLTAEQIFKKTRIGEKYKPSVLAAISKLASKNKVKRIKISADNNSRKIWAYTTIKDPVELGDKEAVGK